MLLALFAAQSLTIGSAWAVEVTGQIRGSVVDTDGLPIPGATVTVSGPNYQAGASVTSDEDGGFRFTSLPPGEYAVEVRKEGFLPYRATGLLVFTGGVASLEVGLELAVPGEELTVTEMKPTVDVQKVQTGAVFTRDTLRDIPNAGRSYQSATALAPGVNALGMGGNPSVRGSFSDGNQFNVDGVNSTDPMTGTFSQNMNFDAIEEVQVVTGGMDAEYGRSLGGAINIVTRSGGNEYHGDAQLLVTHTAMQAYTPLPGEEDPALVHSEGLALNLGGPILKDKLWFFVSLQGDNEVSTIFVPAEVGRPEPVTPSKWMSGYLFGKLTFRADDQNRIWLHAQGDPTHIENVEQGYGNAYTLASGETIQDQSGYLVSAGHLYTPNPKTILQTQVYWQRSDITYFPIQCKGEADVAGCIDGLGDSRWLAEDPDGFNAGAYPYGYLSQRYRASLNTALTRYVDLLGEHAFKIGANGEYLVNDDAYPGEGDIVYKTRFHQDGTVVDAVDTDNYENAYRLAYTGDETSHLSGLMVSAFVQDVWNPVERLTVRPGVRMDYASISDDEGNEAFSSVTFAPRFGLAFDLTDDGRTNLHAYYGRFYDTGLLAISQLLHRRRYGSSVYNWDPGAGEFSSVPSQTSAGVNLQGDNLRNPYSDELDLGIGRDVGGGWGVDATFTYEKSQRFWEDDEVNLVWNAEGTDVIGNRNGTNEAIYRILTPEDAYTEYTSLEVTVNKQFTDNFGVIGSYVWSRAYGTNDAQYATVNFDNPEQADVETGLLSYDRTHALKLVGSARDPQVFRLSEDVRVGFLAGWNFQAMSGTPYGRLNYNVYNQGWTNLAEPVDGTYRLPLYSQLDLKGGITVAVARTTWDITAECFNVLNDRTVTDVEQTYGNEAGTGVYGVEADGVGDPIYGTPLQRQSPRYFQLGLRGEF